jgi:CRP-like cAMP-binding protein
VTGRFARRAIVGHVLAVMLNLLPAPLEIMRMVNLFEGVSDRDLEHLADSLKERSFSEGDVILTEGEGGVGFFVIGEGTVTYSVDGKDVRSGSPGEYFGEVALISDGQRSATVTAASDVTVYGMTLWDFRALVQNNPDVASRLLQVMAERQGLQS